MTKICGMDLKIVTKHTEGRKGQNDFEIDFKLIANKSHFNTSMINCNSEY